MADKNDIHLFDLQSIVEKQIEFATDMTKMLQAAVLENSSVGKNSDVAKSPAPDDVLGGLPSMLAESDSQKVLKALSSEWSSQHVALQSLFPMGLAMPKLTADLTSFWLKLGETMSAVMRLNGIISQGWMRAAAEYAEASAEIENLIDGDTDSEKMNRNWVSIAEPILQDVLRSPEYLEAQAEFVRVSAAFAKSKRELLSRVSDFLDVPSREEMDQAYEVIQEMQREIRSLRRSKQAEPQSNARPATNKRGASK